MATKERRKAPPGVPKYHRLTEERRIIIETLRKEGCLNRHIAEAVGYSPSTVGRELRRNLGRKGCRHRKAQSRANHRAAVKAAKRRRFAAMEQVPGIKVYFAKPCHSWERGRTRTATASSGRSCPRGGRSATPPGRRCAGSTAFSQVPQLANAGGGVRGAPPPPRARGRIAVCRSLTLPAPRGSAAATRREAGRPDEAPLQPRIENATMPPSSKKASSAQGRATGVALANCRRERMQKENVMDFRDFIDSSYDKSFQKIMEAHPLTWFPWVGRNYRKARLKILVVAESHYANDNDPQKLRDALENCADDVNFTREVMFESAIEHWYGNSMLEGL